MLDSILTSSITLSTFAICTAVSLLFGAATAWLHARKSACSQSFTRTVAVLPVLIQAVILLVNGNLGAGVAVAGAFSLVRFRSAPGTAEEIGTIFLAMAIGLATGMGYIGVAVLLFVSVEGFQIILKLTHFGTKSSSERELKITIAENIDYEGLFDDIFPHYTTSAVLESVKTSNMGTLYELKYRICLKDDSVPKSFMDELRCRNGNLAIVCGRPKERENL